MRCPRCGFGLALGSKFCSNCALPLSAAAPQPLNNPQSQPITGQPVQGRMNPPGLYQVPGTTGGAVPYGFIPQKKKVWPYVLSGLVALIFAILLLRATGLLAFGRQSADSRLALHKKQSAPVLVIPSKVESAPLAVGHTRIVMPDDIYQWLKHLERCEAAKKELDAKEALELNQMIPMMQGMGGVTSVKDVNRLTDPDDNTTTPPGTDMISDQTGRMLKDWQALQQRFERIPPPEECKPIATAYSSALTEVQATIGDIVNIVSGLNVNSADLGTDIHKSEDTLHGIGKNHVQSVDANFTSTNNLVQQICDKYDTKKWFSIDAHGGGDSLFSGFGS